jgi:hypothetical protein
LINFVYIATDDLEFAPEIEAWVLDSNFRVKIGRTKDPKHCLMQLRRGNPDIQFIHLWFIPWRAVEVEHALHKRYSEHRISGEFFNFNYGELRLLESIPANDFGDMLKGYLPEVLMERAPMKTSCFGNFVEA